MAKIENIKSDLNRCDTAVLKKAEKENLISIKELVDRTIDISYESVYSEKCINFFKKHHSLKNIEEDLKKENVMVLELNNEIIGTGTLAGNEIGRVFIIPEFQGKGFGKIIMKKLEEIALLKKIERINLDSSLVAYKFYKSLDYMTIKEEMIKISEENKLNYFEMEKIINVN